jgi:serine protease
MLNRHSFAAILVGFLTTVVGTLTLTSSLILASGANAADIVDSDGDGLSDQWEAILGTNLEEADTDGDGLADGGDPDILAAWLANLDVDVFKNGGIGLRIAADSRLAAAEQMFLAGDIAGGLQALKNLRQRFDGCPPKPDPNDWLVVCDSQLSAQELLDLLIANHFSFSVDEAVAPAVSVIPGLSGYPPRPLVSAVAPDGSQETFVAAEVILHPDSPEDLAAFLARYGGTVIRDGTPLFEEDAGMPPADLPFSPDTGWYSSGWYLVAIDTSQVDLAGLAADMDAAGLHGAWTFSSDEAARTAAVVAHERDAAVGFNFVMDTNQTTCTVCEHPDKDGDYVDASEWWWMKDQGLSISVIRAWDYLRYKGYPPVGVPYFPVRIAVIDNGFDLDTTTGVPLLGNLDYFYSGSKPPQLDEVDGDWTAGGTVSGFASCPKCGGCATGGDCPSCCWHGQMSFGVCCAKARNLFGTAGTNGGEARTSLIKIGPDIYIIATGVYDALYNNADVINMSLSWDCGWLCREFVSGNVLEAAVGSASNLDVIVVASAGNDEEDITNADRYPCELKDVICVGAIDDQAKAQSYSNWGGPVSIWAPAGIRSTVTRNSIASDQGVDMLGEDELQEFGGTSCSSPFVAGIVSMMRMLDGSLTPQQADQALIASANPGGDLKVSPGYVDALGALQQVAPNQPPSVSIVEPGSGASVPYVHLSLAAEVDDPEWSGLYGAQFPASVRFTSDVNGHLCTVKSTDPEPRCTLNQLLTPGGHLITAIITDAFGATATDSITVEVVNQPPLATITYPADGAIFYDSQTINFQGYGFDPDGGTITQLEWRAYQSSLGLGPSISTKLVAANYTIDLIATDEVGGTGSDSIDIQVLAGAGYPSAQITKPATGSVFGLGQFILFEGTGNDPEDGTLSGNSLKWYSNHDGLLGSGTAIRTTLSGVAEGQQKHTITLEATDSDGKIATHAIEVIVLDLQ